LPFFENRLMPSTRPDYVSYVTQLGLPASGADDFAILARSGGQRSTEQSEIEIFAPPVLRPDGRHETYFLVRSMRYVHSAELTLAHLQDGDQLACMLDVQNAFNHKAVVLRVVQRQDQSSLGYIPNYLCDDVSDLLKRGCEVRVSVARANPLSVPRRILCHFEARFPPDFRPFSRPEFKPISDNAFALAA
jgi:hypothetical protein